MVSDSTFARTLAFLGILLLAPFARLHGADPPTGPRDEPPPLIKPPESTGTGLLLEPPMDLSKFTTAQFVALSSSVGTNRIHKKWTCPVVTLPPHQRAGVHGLTEQEVKD